MGKIKVALAGVGNCASALIQGIQYYRKNAPTENGLTTGLMHPSFGPYKVEDITFVAAFEVNRKKIGADLSKAIFTEPNSAPKISDVPDMDVTVKAGPTLDGVAPHMKEAFHVYSKSKTKPVDLCLKRGVRVDESYQLNLGGDTDFLNMTVEERLHSKRISKTTAVASLIPYSVPTRIGPSDYVPHLKNKKICYIYLKGRGWGNIPLQIDLKLAVEDSPNSGGVVADVIRAVKIGLDRGIGGPLTSISSYSFKYPPVKIPDSQAWQWVEEYIQGKRER